MPPLFNMIVGIHQLHYLPWLRYIHKIACSDVFVILDNIQFNKNGWQNRNKIKTPQGAAILTVPVFNKFAQSLADVRIDDKQGWRKKHWGSLLNYYRKTPYFKEHEVFFNSVYGREWQNLNDLNYEILFYLVKALGIRSKILKGTELDLRGDGTDRLVGICKDLGASAYLTGAYAAEAYLDRSLFEKEKVDLFFQTFECPVYQQLFPEAGFIPELSILDMLFNCGPKTLELLKQGSGYIAAQEAQ